MMAARGERGIAITGIGQSEIARPSRHTPHKLTAMACLAAIQDAGLQVSDIDGIASWPGKLMFDPGLGPVAIDEVKEMLGLKLNWYAGGVESSQFGPLFAGIAAISAGFARHVLVFRTVAEARVRGQTNNVSAQSGERVPDSRFQWQVPFGALSATNWVAIYAQRHFHEFGTSPEQLAQIPLNSRRNAAINPKAIYRDPLSLDDYLAARMISSPLRLYDCDVPVDASTALILSRVEEARDMPHPVTRFDAIGSAVHDRYSWDSRPDLTTMAAHDAARMLWSRTDLRPRDVDMAQLYDGFSILTLLWLEALGFAPHGQGGAFVEGGSRIARDGELPLNTHGSQLSEGRTHGFGFLHESVLQMRGIAGERQLAKQPEVVITAVGGGPLAGCALLVRD